MAGRRQHGEGSLYQRKSNGRWVAVVELPARGAKRERREFTAATPEAAMGKRRRFLEARSGGFTIPKGRPPYAGEWMLHWLNNVAKPRVEATTWHSGYRQKVEDLIVPYFERVPLPELDEEMIEAWHRHLERKVSRRTGRPLSANTIGQCHRILSAGLKVAVVRHRMPRNPCSNVTPPKVTRRREAPPDPDVARQILARCGTWPNGARWVLALATGLRQGEALALQWKRDVKLTAPATVSVHENAARVGRERIVKAPKSDTSRRVVPLAAVAVARLREHKQSQGVRAIRKESDLVFTTPDGRPVHPRTDRQDWYDLLADLGLPRCRPHELRRAFATMLLEMGEDPRVVQELLGHSTTALLQVYQHVRPEILARAVARLDEALGGEA